MKEWIKPMKDENRRFEEINRISLIVNSFDICNYSIKFEEEIETYRIHIRPFDSEKQSKLVNYFQYAFPEGKFIVDVDYKENDLSGSIIIESIM